MTNLEKLQKQQDLLEAMFSSMIEVMSDALIQNRAILDGTIETDEEVPEIQVEEPMEDPEVFYVGQEFVINGFHMTVFNINQDDLGCKGIGSDGKGGTTAMDFLIAKEVALTTIQAAEDAADETIKEVVA